MFCVGGEDGLYPLLFIDSRVLIAVGRNSGPRDSGNRNIRWPLSRRQPGAGQMYVASPGAFGTSQLTSDYLTLYNQPGGIQIVFVNPISSFSANIGMLRNFGPEPTSDPKSLLFTAGTWGNNTVVEPINLPALYLMGGADWAAISFSFSTPVQVIQFFDPSWGLALDDVTYSVAQTPIPTALPLFGTGLGLMGLMGWWRKRRADMAG